MQGQTARLTVWEQGQFYRIYLLLRFIVFHRILHFSILFNITFFYAARAQLYYIQLKKLYIKSTQFQFRRFYIGVVSADTDHAA